MPVMRALAMLAMALLLAAPATAQEGTGSDELSLEAVMEQGTQRTAGGSVRPPADAVDNAPRAPGETRPNDFVAPPVDQFNAPLAVEGPNSDATLWGLAREGETFTTQAGGPVADFLVQDAGMPWLTQRKPGGELHSWSLYAMLGVLALLLLFFLLRGRIRIDKGKSGETIERFKGIERFGHWLLAVSFILLALSGLNLLYGKDVLVWLYADTLTYAEDGTALGGTLVNGQLRGGMMLSGEGGYAAMLPVFAEISLWGKWIHNNVAWPFMIGLVLIFVMWVVHNFPSRVDLIWLAKGGGLFSKGVHPPARKFNAGQKLIFWSTILLGASVSASGISLLFPYELPMFAKTFAVLNDLGAEALLGFALPTTLTPIQEMQYAQLWHTIVAVAMIVVIVAHIYIGSVGMEGAFDAMGSGQVDRSWAEEHHGLWVDEVDAREGRAHGARSPAE